MIDDRPAGELDDERDRSELRSRYYGLLQELRVLLPGVQILVAFLLTVPFAARFSSLSGADKAAYGISLGAGMLAVIVFVAPTAFHRVGARQARAERLVWGIRLLRVGLILLGLSLVASSVLVCDLVFGGLAATVAGLMVMVAMVGTWLVLPLVAEGHPQEGQPAATPAD